MKKQKLILPAALLTAVFMWMLFSCSNGNIVMDRAGAEELADKIIAESSIFSENMIRLGDNSVSNIFPFTDDSPWKIFFAGESGVKADEFLIVEAPSSERLDEYRAKIEGYIENRISQFSGYAPEEVPKLRSALLYCDGPYLIYMVCADTQAAKELINNIDR